MLLVMLQPDANNQKTPEHVFKEICQYSASPNWYGLWKAYFSCWYSIRWWIGLFLNNYIVTDLFKNTHFFCNMWKEIQLNRKQRYRNQLVYIFTITSEQTTLVLLSSNSLFQYLKWLSWSAGRNDLSVLPYIFWI